MFGMRRREFITLLGGAAAAWPLAARAQQLTKPVIGFLRSGSLNDVPHFVNAFRQGLKETDYVEGRNVVIEFRSADNQRDRLPALVADLLGRPVSVIAGDNVAALAAKAATKTIPIVFAGGGDPVQEGLVASLNRPGGNVTGVNFFAGVLGPKRLELLLQLVPKATTIAVLVNPNTTETEEERRDVQAAARAIGRQLVILDVSSDRDIELAFATFAQRGAGALLIGSGGFLNSSKRERLVALAARHRLPAVHAVHDRHAGHSVAMFRDKFWFSLLLTRSRRRLVGRGSALARLPRAVVPRLSIDPSNPRYRRVPLWGSGLPPWGTW